MGSKRTALGTAGFWSIFPLTNKLFGIFLDFLGKNLVVSLSTGCSGPGCLALLPFEKGASSERLGGSKAKVFKVAFDVFLMVFSAL